MRCGHLWADNQCDVAAVSQPFVDALLRVGNRLPIILPKQLESPRVRYPLLEEEPRVIVQRG